MFKKVLIAEDLDSINHSVVQTLKKVLHIPLITQAFYCDDAVLKVLKSKQENEPYELLITDLSFVKDHRPQKLKSGKELVTEIRKLQPSIKVLVYSIENRPSIIKPLFIENSINGYICKGRTGLKELQKAIPQIYYGTNYISQEMERTLKSEIFEIDDYDIRLLKRLAEGDSQEEIAAQFKQDDIQPNSISTIEKRLNKLKMEFKSKNTTQLVAVVKDLGFI